MESGCVSRMDASGREVRATDALPGWAEWIRSISYTVGIEEEVMILDPNTWALARNTDAVLASVPERIAPQVHAETHQAAAELATTPHRSAADAGSEAAALRRQLLDHLRANGLRAAAAGTHPLAEWRDVQVSDARRYQAIYETTRELARREPTFALHVHVGVSDSDRAIVLANRLRAHVPLLLALSANSPFWQGRDSGLDSTRIPIFQAFPRVGIPRVFASYEDYVEVVDRLLRCGAIPEPTFLWWDVRLQPMLGTVEVRVMDAQITAGASAALASLVQTIAHLELEEGYHGHRTVHAAEVLAENRFLAARDGMRARLIDVTGDRLVPVRQQLAELLSRARPHAEELGCADAMARIEQMAESTAAGWQRQIVEKHGLAALSERLAERFTESPA
jgi:carboxylate-amine ligase